MSDDLKNKMSKIKAAADKQMEWYEANKERLMQEREQAAVNNKNCLTYWYPKIKNLPGVLTPQTFIYPLHFLDQISLLDGKVPDAVKKVIEQITQDLPQLGTPFFLKNSLFSGKHNWNNTCFVHNPQELLNHIGALTDFAYCVDCGDSSFLIARSLIKTSAPFTAFNGMPVTRERRYFIQDGKVVFHHPYWPPFSIKDPSIPNWEPELAKLNTEPLHEIQELKLLAETVGQVLPGYWSVDFLQGTDGKWYLIDMAEGDKSFRWTDYPNGLVGL